MIGVIAPWNYPFHNVYNHIISGIFAGNAVVSKVSEYTCWSSRCGGALLLLRCCSGWRRRRVWTCNHAAFISRLRKARGAIISTFPV